MGDGDRRWDRYEFGMKLGMMGFLDWFLRMAFESQGKARQGKAFLSLVSRVYL